MDTSFYINQFQKVASQINKDRLVKKHIEIAVGVILNSVFLKLYKKSWATPFEDALTAESRIFFSIWINDAAIKEQKLLYNIHALKLRKLKGYSIQSRKFADVFRKNFKNFDHQWKNVKTDFGPLTLMEGWIEIDLKNFEKDILKLANNFLEIEQLVDTTLINFKK